MTKKGRRVTEIDKIVGTRLRAARQQAGLSQMAACADLGISFQQIQKYENGTNRISAGRLYVFAEICGVPIEWFFAGIKSSAAANGADDILAKLLAAPHGADLARDYLAIPDDVGRQAVASVAHAFARRAQ